MRFRRALSFLAGGSLWLSSAGAADPDTPGFTIEAGQFSQPSAPCFQAHNGGLDIVAEYLDARGDITLRAGSWLGRDGRYLLPRPTPEVETIRFRSLEGIAIDSSDVALAPCPDDLPEIAVASLSRAIDRRLGRYLGEATGDFELADDYETAIETLEATPHHHWLAVARFEFASYLRAIDRLDEADAQYRAALDLFDAIDDPGGRVASINSLGLVALRQGRLDDAIGRFDEAQPLFLQLGDLHSVAAVDNNLGLLYMRRNQLGDAAAHFEMALSVLQGPVDLRSASPNPDQELPPDSPADLNWALNTLGNLAIVRRQQGSVDLAERYWRNVLALEGQANRALTGAQARHNLGGLMLRQGRLDEALIMLSEAVDQFDVANARRWMVEARIMLSQLYFHLGDFESSLEFAHSAVELQPEDLNAKLRAYRHLAELQQEAGEYGQATATVDRAMELIEDRPDDPQFLMLSSRRAHLQVLAGEVDDGLELQRAVHDSVSKLDRPAQAARAAYRLAVALIAAGASREARTLLEDALTVFRDTREVFHELKALDALGKLQIDDRDAGLAASTHAFERALQLRNQPLSDTRRIGMSATLARIDQRHVQRLMDQGRIEDAWQAVARIRSTDVHDLEQAHRRGQTQPDRQALLDEHAELIDELHRRRLDEEADAGNVALALKIDRLETRLRQLHEPPQARQKPSLKAVQQHLASERVLLSYYLLPERGLLWAISGSEVRTFELPERSRFEHAIPDLLTRLRHPRQAPGAIDRLARELGSALVEPASEMIAGAEEVVIEPHGVLHALPFGVLISDGRALADRVSVERVIASGHSPAREPATVPGHDRMLVVANPGWQDDLGQHGPLPRRSLVGQLMRDNALARLPGTQREAELLAALDTPGLDMRLRTGRAASRQFVLDGGLAGYPLVHLATHGLVDLQYPSLSALLLADENGPGAALLRPQEIAELRLDAGLVVLSGCETGTGPIPAGEGALSLARPFLVAGARQVVSTLWKIDDQRTALFMQAFYKHLLLEARTPARALAAAQGEMRQERATAHPYYWAGFVVTGATLQR